MLQYFNTSWSELAQKMPELAEVGYNSLWLPPPTKGSGGLSVGYDLFDRFDLGGKDQRGTISTRYGTEAELLRLVETAHRFGIRVYFDNIMNHNAFDVPGYNADTPIDVYPGFVPEDFHLRVTSDGYYRKWDNVSDWNNSWQIQNRNFSDLIDIAQEPGTTNKNFGAGEGYTFPKIKFLRQPNNPEYYCYDANANYVGFGTNNGLTPQYLQQNAAFYSEYVQDFLNRSARWIMDRTKADGLRLDAVKHVSYDFFGASFGADKDFSDYGYVGQAQRQFAITRGFNDKKFNTNTTGLNSAFVNLRETVFDTEKPRHNAMMFGEHLGQPPAYGDYFNAGMRLVDNTLHSNMNNMLGNPAVGLNGLDGAGSFSFGTASGVMFAQSHDDDYASRRELQHALYLTRQGLGNIYTDGNYQSQILSQSGGAFPRHANTNFLGQFGDNLIPNLVYIHNQFGRGDQLGKWGDADLVAYQRMDKRENPSMSNADAVTMLALLNDNYANGIGINNDPGNNNRGNLRTDFPPGAYLYQYAKGNLPSGDVMNNFYTTVGDGGGGLGYIQPTVIVPKGGYYVFSWKNPDPSDLWAGGGGNPITILQNGQPAGTLAYTRKDGPDGDPNFNPYGVSGAVAGSYSYPYTIPRVTDASNLSFIVRTDGSAENVLLKLDGGIDLNGGGNTNDPIGKRDNPPALSTDVFLGYEQPIFVDRIGPEKFAAATTPTSTSSRCIFGSAGAETYTAGGATVNGSGTNPQDSAAATFVYHDPIGDFGSWSGTHPARQFTDGGTFEVWAQTNSVGGGFRMFVYYTSDGSNPEGAGGVGIGTTQTAEMLYQSPNTAEGYNWWRATGITRPAGTLKYKIGIHKSGQPSQFPSGSAQVSRKNKMMTTFQITGFDGSTKVFYPHNDFGVTQTGLSEGFHVLRARAFLQRGGRASIYNTFTQTFYYDAQLPQGEVKFPAQNDSIGGQQYGAVVRTDPSVTEVWYKILDSDSTNDDSVLSASTGGTVANGNNTWVKAAQVTPGVNSAGVPSISSTYPIEWRFNYVNIPSSGSAQILVRLRELSSTAMTAGNTTNDATGDAANNWTTLVRNVTTAGPNIRLFVAYPQSDGTLVDSNYVMKVWFSKSLADNTTPSQLLSRFVINIKSSDSPSDTGVVQPQNAYSINYNINNDYHELAYQLPNLYNGNPDFLHTITVTHTNRGTPTLVGTRRVKAFEVSVIKNNIITPPEVDSDGKAYVIVLPDVASPTPAQRTVPIQVETDLTATSVAINFTYGSGTVALDPGISPNPSSDGSRKLWNFSWTNVAKGTYSFTSSVTTPTGSSTTIRSTTVVFEQIVADDPNRQDVDDDGLGFYGPTSAPIESTRIALPTTNSDSWTNGQVHVAAISGKTDPLNPDTDNEGMSDGLELGWATAIGDTNTSTDTNGDGVKNFQPDLDPPIYNTTDNANAPAGQNYGYFSPWPYNYNNGRTDQIAGTLTDPTNPDTDGDAVSDGVEDRTYLITRDVNGVPTNFQIVYNGRVDILPNGLDGEKVIVHPPTSYNTSTIERNKIPTSAAWLEPDPNSSDTRGSEQSDGSKDANGNGIVDLAIIDRNQTDANGNYVVLATLDDFKKSVTVTGTAPGSTPQTFRYCDFCYTYTQNTNGFVTPDNTVYTSTALSRTKLDTVFRPGGNFRGDQLDVIWLETDPRRFSTSGTSLPDGWKIRYGLDPWDDGVAGHYNMRTGKPSNPVNGNDGNPSGDGNPLNSNLNAYIAGKDPRIPTGTPPPPVGAITIGPVPDSAVVTKGAVTNRKEFTDWTANDLIALDYYDGDGPNNSASDIHHANDGWDSSRDLVAFYAHDGGDPINGGDDTFYFRVDMNDLQALAEQSSLEIYVAINVGNPGVGEYSLPEDIDTGTSMRWQAVVVCSQSNNGRVYVDTNRANNSTSIGQNLSSFGVLARDQNAVNGFKKAYYNSSLDSVEFSISRQALKDAGWDGVDATKLTYQVFTTKDGTQNSPTVGAGDIGGRSDIRDSIRNDWIASDYWQDQANIAGAKSVLNSWIGLQADNDRGKSVKVVPLIHGNQAILPGSSIQSLINNSQGAGYYRPLDVHEAYNVPLTMHITPTLASAIQWAAVSPSSTRSWVDGPALNQRIKSLASSGLVDVIGSTFSDHILPYFNKPFNLDNVSLASDFLNAIYGGVSSSVFWTPERVSNDDVLDKISNLGFQYTFVDQLRHLLKWFGRTPALGTDAYRINQINAMKCFVINDGLGQYMFQNTDNGTPWQLRQLLEHRARVGPNDQVIVLVNNWEDFAVKANADACDKNIAWMANHPWIQIVTPDQIVAGQVPYLDGSNNTQTAWGTANRGTGLALAKVAKDWIDHATQESYDNWYNGSALEEALVTKVFNIRTGVPVPTAYGLQGTGGVINSAWSAVSGLSVTNPTISKLARGVLHASVFETAFHNQTANDLTKFSTGAYVYPDTTSQNLAGFAKIAQAQSRMAAIYSRLDTWASTAKTGAYNSSSVAEQTDVDLDGENEYILHNDRIFALFEKIGGRLANAWVRDLDTDAIVQVVGNPSSYSGSETEEEGAANIVGDAVAAYRTSGFKDWFPYDGSGNSYVNQLYSVQQVGTGWKFTSPDGRIAKTISLEPRATVLAANYQLTNIATLYVRHGLSPNLSDLLINGQKNLPALSNDATASELNLFNTSGNQTRTFLRYGGTGYSGASPNLNAVDRDQGVVFDTINMRNQAQTQQIELSGGNGMTFALGLQTGSTISYSTAHDGIPDWWKMKYFGAGVDLNNAGFGSQLAPAGDGKTNSQKWVLGEDPTVANYNGIPLRISRTPTAATVHLPTLFDRVYRVFYKNNLSDPSWTQLGSDINGTGANVLTTDPSPPSTHRFYRAVVISRTQP
jgi:hypothetical protein